MSTYKAAGASMRNSLGGPNPAANKKGDHAPSKNEDVTDNIPERQDEDDLDASDDKEQKEAAQEQPNKLATIMEDMSTKEGFKELLRFQMRVFDQHYDFHKDELVGGES